MRKNTQTNTTSSGLLFGVLVAAITLALGSSSAVAESIPSAKATVAVSDTVLVPEDAEEDTWHTILTQQIKTPNNKHLAADASLEIGLYTDTEVKSKNGKKDTSEAEAQVDVRVLVNGEEMWPGVVTYGRRQQILMASLGGVLTEDALEVDPDTGEVTIIEEELEEEEIQLILDTMDANAFNFVYPVGSEVNTVEVQARTHTNEEWEEGSAEAYALVGKGAVTIDEIRLIKDEDVQQ